MADLTAEQRQFLAENLDLIGQYDLAKLHDQVFFEKVNSLLDFTYVDTHNSGHVVDVMVMEDTYRKGEIDCSSEVTWTVNPDGKPPEEQAADITNHVVEMYGSISNFRLVKAFGELFRNKLEFDGLRATISPISDASKLVQLCYVLSKGGEFCDDWKMLHAETEQHPALKTNKYDVTLYGIRCQRWKNGKFVLTLGTTLQKTLMDAMETLQARNWSRCKTRVKRKLGF